MPRLPDIREENWLEYQSRRFQEATAGLFPALEFEAGARDAESQIPPDYDAPGGMDQWEDAEREMLERQYRLAQQQDEERRQQELEAQAEQYRQQQAQAEAEQAAQAEQKEQSFMDMVRGLGIPMPGDVFNSLGGAGDSTSSTGVFDVSAPQPGASQPPVSRETQPPSDVDAFNQFASGMSNEMFGAPTPPPEPPRDNESSSGLLDQIGSAVSGAASSVGNALSTTFGPSLQSEVENPERTPEREALARMDEMYGGLGQGPRWLVENLGAGKMQSDINERRDILTEAAQGAPPPTARETLQPTLSPEYRAANPAKAARFDEIERSLQDVAMGASGGLGRGTGITDDALDAIKQVIKAGFGDEALSMERKLAEKSTMTLDEIQRLTRGVEVPSGVTLTPEEEALNAAADARARAAPPHAGYLEDPTFGAVDEVPPPVRAGEIVDESVPPGTSSTPEPPQSAQSVGPARAPEPFTPEAERPSSYREASERAQAAIGKPAPLNREERVAAAAKMLKTEPERVQQAIEDGLRRDPYNAGVTQEALYQRADEMWEAWDDARMEWVAAKNEMDDWRFNNPGSKADGLDDDVAERVQYWFGEMTRLGHEMFGGIKAPKLVVQAASKELNAARGGRLGSMQIKESRRLKSVADTAGEAADAAKRVGDSGVVDDDALRKLGDASRRLGDKKNVRVITGRSKTARDVEKQAREATSGRGGRGRGSSTPPDGGAGTTPSRGRGGRDPLEETLAERLGRLKREQGRFENMLDEGAEGPVRQEGGQGRQAESFRSQQREPLDPTARTQIEEQLTLVRTEIEETLAQAREELAEQVRRRLGGKEGRLSDAELDRMVDGAVGRKALGKMRSEELRRQRGLTGYEGAINKDVQRAIDKHYRDEKRLLESIDKQMQRRIDGALATEQRREVRSQIKDMADRARVFANELRRKPGELDELAGQYNEQQFDQILREMEEHSNVGAKVAGEMRERLWSQVGKEMTRREEVGYQAGQRAIDEARIRSVKQQIDEVLKNPHAPGSHERIGALYRDLAEINQYGTNEASRMARHAHEAGIMKSGLFDEGVDKDKLLTLMANIDPDDPSTFRPIQELMTRPSLWHVAREISFINMLSQPVTHLTNISSTLANIGLRGVLRPALEEFYSGHWKFGETRAGLTGLTRGAGEGARLFGQTMQTGINPRRLERMAGTGEYRHLGQEALPNLLSRAPVVGGTLGRWAQLGHMVSTRPLEAADAFLGHVAYTSAFNQHAVRYVDDLIRRNDSRLKTMIPEDVPGTQRSLREQAMAHIHENPWDYPELIKQAGMIEDYTLFRTKGTGTWETALRGFMGLKEVPKDAPIHHHAGAAIFDFLMPFWNVPYNFTKQGIGNVLAPVKVARAGKRYLQGDTRGAAEDMAHATQGAAMLVIPTALAMSDSITGAGPRDQAQRRVWEADHKPNSWYAPGYGWVSYEGTPWAIPFAIVAGIKEGYEFGEIDADASPSEHLIAGVLNGAQGALKGATSQSFLDSALRGLGLFTGEELSAQAGASHLANTALRYQPTTMPSGVMNFLAQMSDEVMRDPGRARDLGDVLEVSGNIIESRIPGLRQGLPEKREAFGDVVPNERSGLRAAAPRSLLPERAPRQDDPITRQLQRADVGIPTAPKELTIGRGQVPLTINEQQRFQEVYGSEYRKILEKHGAGERTITDKDLEYMRTMARENAAIILEREIGRDEVRKRWHITPPVEVAP